MAKTFSNTNLVESRNFKRENDSLLVDMRRSKAFLLKLPNNNIIQEPCAICLYIETVLEKKVLCNVSLAFLTDFCFRK